MKKILFISHDAQRAGAPILLLRFLRLLKSQNNIHFDILVKHAGPLQSDFEAISEVQLWNKNFKLFNSDTAQHWLFRAGLLAAYQNWQLKQHHKAIIQYIKSKNYDLVVANTIATGDILYAIGPLNCPIVSYIHELQMAFGMFSKPHLIDYQLKNSKAFWVPSRAVANNMTKNWQVPAEKITVLRTVTDATYTAAPAAKVAQLKSQLTIDPDKKIVGVVATLDRRKGNDIFVEVLRLCKNEANLHFVWLGAKIDAPEYGEMQQILKMENLDKLASICTSNPDTAPYFTMFDMLLIPSREDPYPLVTLEAAQYAKPIIAFDEQAGGACDFIEQDCGIIVPYLQTKAMAEAVITLAKNNELRMQLGANAAKKVIERHRPEVGLAQIVSLINA